MRHFILVIFTFSLTSDSVLAQTQNLYFQIDTAPGRNPWSSLEINDHPEEFQFAIITDRTGGHRPGVFEKGIDKLNLLQPEFVISVGDLIEGYTEDTAVLNAEWDEMEGFISELTMPFFYVAGNHDMTNEVMGRIWNERFGRTYYHFVYKDVLFLLLNSEDQYRGSGKGTISDQQYQYVKETLEKYSEVKHTLLFMHQPLWAQEEAAKWPEIEQILGERSHTVFVGHKHAYVKYERNNGRYFILATTGGGSLLRGPDLGQFDHVVWVTMKQEGPLIANLMLDGIYDEDVFTDEKKQFISEVLDHRPIRVDPLFVEEDDFKEGEVKLHFRNLQKNEKMKVDLVSGFGWDLVGSLDQHSAVVEPGDSLTTTLGLMNRNETSLALLRPIPLQISLRYQVSGLGEVRVPYKYFIKPMVKRYLDRSGEDLVIDGDLKDWSDLPIRMSQSDQSDNEVIWNVHADHAYLYLGARVTDDTILVDNDLPSWKQDGFGWELRLSTGSDVSGRVSATQFRVNPSTGDESQKFYRGEHWPQGVEYVGKGNDEGYEIELKVPLSMLHSDWEKWKQIRINFFMDDKDGISDPVRVRWRPEWRSAKNILGSGVFFRK